MTELKEGMGTPVPFLKLRKDIFMKKKFETASCAQVELLDSNIKNRFTTNEKLLLRYQSRELLRNYYFEAGLWKDNSETPHIEHWGWEGPTSEIRGHFTGHWLSATAMSYATNRNEEIRGRAEFVIKELERCQKANGGEWIGAISEKQLKWTEKGRNFGVPLYNLHKIIMGLTDMYLYTDSARALEIVGHFADWFYRWVKDKTNEEMSIIMETETGGILEEWCKLMQITGEKKYEILMDKFLRRPLLDAMEQKKDILTNMHANTTIPEILGIARLYEITGEEKYLEAVKNYWKCAVDERGAFVTGGQTSGEVWVPQYRLRERLGKLNQEHCTVYNMMRLAEFLFQYTGDSAYEDYRELNLYNGILAQQNPETGAAAYYLPLQAGGRKIWSTEKRSFWCCCGSVIQAGASHATGIYAEDEETIVINQFIPSIFTSTKWGRKVEVIQNSNQGRANVQGLISNDNIDRNSPERVCIYLSVKTENAENIVLMIRIPFWNQKRAELWVQGKRCNYSEKKGYMIIPCNRQNFEMTVIFYQGLTIHEMEGTQDMIAFRYGPTVLAGITEKDVIHGDRSIPESILVPHNERIWGSWTKEYRSQWEEENINFKPLNEITDENYTVYFLNRRKDNEEKQCYDS